MKHNLLLSVRSSHHLQYECDIPYFRLSQNIDQSWLIQSYSTSY
ncbi:hypothetical protein EVA_04667 [gut metagenome]|uniref:Uncharacterized protein n=1 Tax=gut metagenome TaxID=749906 RepID=J9GI42_9ZZZZ